MKILHIALIPLKLLLKLIGYILAGALKVVGWFIRVVGTFCGLVTGIIGGIAILASVFYLVMGFAGTTGIKEMDTWWLPGLLGCIFGAVLASMGTWAVYVGDLLSDIADNIIFGVNDISLLG